MKIGSIKIAGIERITKVLLRNFTMTFETGDRMGTASFLILAEPGLEATVDDAVVGSASLGVALDAGQVVQIYETNVDTAESGIWGEPLFGEPLFGEDVPQTLRFSGTIVKLDPKVLVTIVDSYGTSSSLFGGPLFGDSVFDGTVAVSRRLNLIAVECRDWNSLLDGTTVSGEFSNTTDGAIITSLFAALPQVSLTGVSGTTHISTLSVTDQTLRNVLGQLSERTGAIYYIDENLVLNYFLPTSRLAPFSLSESPDRTTSFPFERDSFQCSYEWRTPCNSATVVGAVQAGGVNLRVVTTDQRSILTYGTFSRTITDRNIKSTDEAIARGKQELAKNAWPQVQGSLVTYTDGLSVGDFLKLEIPLTLHINARYVIRRISCAWLSKTVTAYTVEFGQYLPDVARAFRAIAELAAANPAIQPTVPVDGSVGSGAIIPGAVNNAALAANSVGNVNIQAAAVGSANIQNAAIQEAHIGDAEITSAKIGNLQVTNAHVASGLSASKITTDNLTVGGSGAVGQILVRDGSGNSTGYIGGTADGGWFKALAVGGTGVSTAKFKVSSSGDLLLALGAGDTFQVTGGAHTVTIDYNNAVQITSSGYSVLLNSTNLTITGASAVVAVSDGSGHGMAISATGKLTGYLGTQLLDDNRITGWIIPTGTATRGNYATSTATVTQVAEALKALIDDLVTHGLIGV